MASIPDMGIYGDNARCRIFIDGQPQDGTQYATSIKIKPEVNIHKRGHMGRKRKRVGKQLLGYTISLAMDVANLSLWDKLRERDDKRDANQPVPELTVQLTFVLRNGREVSYIATGCEDTTDIDAGDQESEVAYNVEISAEDVRKVA